ncbi:MAG: MarR family winged helix-turn-helix transcriptional regulator [Acutalibacteraceae bacterium]|nr:MarR family winged helix-turn-helix transcriptional regulator [Acutalibacteraceae bacterium]
MGFDIEHSTEFAPVLRSINNLLMRATVQQGKKLNVDNCTIMHGWILGYLCDHKNENVYQRDIEREFCITRSAVTSVVKNMEKYGYIERIGVEHDARLKQIVITELGENMHQKLLESVKSLDKEITKDISEEEYTVFLNVCHKVRNNLKDLL